MCGIAGFLDSKPSSSPSDVVEAMRMRLTHRGPDDHGVWVDEGRGVAFGHCRLSIIDLTSAGHQPMVSASGRYVITYNGELYNHQDLRYELSSAGAAPVWRGHSDTETLLAAIEHWGISSALRRFNGMFAFAIWDRATDSLWLARDRLGEKPLYYGSINGVLLFASELSALRGHPRWRAQIDSTALALYLRFGYVPAPWSIFAGISKLRPGHYVEIRDSGGKVSDPTPFWSLEDAARSEGTAAPDAPDAVEALHHLLLDSVGRRMQADVAVGSFLSGGIDSSTVTSLMQACSPQPVKTFTIGFNEEVFNEAKHAKEVARHLETDHTEVFLEPDDALACVPELGRIWDEPYADPSQIPTLLVSRLARKHVKVVLSGDGGDELFHGYRRYARAQRLWNGKGLIPAAIAPAASDLLSRASLRPLDTVRQKTGLAGRIRPLNQRLNTLVAIMSEDTRAGFYEQFISHWIRPGDVVSRQLERDTIVSEIDKPWLGSLAEAMMWIDTHMYLPDDILVKLDRASMSVGLEARVPLLDHRVVELVWHMPIDQRAAGTNKQLLKQVLFKYVPRDLVERPKMGFGVPIEYWLRGPLREWAEELLDEDTLRQQGYLIPELVRSTWSDHLEGRGRHHFQIWDVLMFQAWLNEWTSPGNV